ncbi:hypothetical protein BWQ96_08584 [Gracilariopsis chorda]|uniref:Uncharacterized protein n=1 Tax=Gracilariopsis chorda TaxID=448386 RepID=A0A2V3II13_9FLOR|nr:hypothetical protein BWQ96_08584 [Gracilariopsis chorda]|eukprot:PXF41699.1 hypothetical protein BWQ96_08584 [Gracilariopsis chorda]
MEYCSKVRLPERTEMLIFLWLGLWWLVGSIALTIVKSSRAPSIAVVPVVLAWILFALCLISALVASRGPTLKGTRTFFSLSQQNLAAEEP